MLAPVPSRCDIDGDLCLSVNYLKYSKKKKNGAHDILKCFCQSAVVLKVNSISSAQASKRGLIRVGFYNRVMARSFDQWILSDGTCSAYIQRMQLLVRLISPQKFS